MRTKRLQTTPWTPTNRLLILVSWVRIPAGSPSIVWVSVLQCGRFSSAGELPSAAASHAASHGKQTQWHQVEPVGQHGPPLTLPGMGSIGDPTPVTRPRDRHIPLALRPAGHGRSTPGDRVMSCHDIQVHLDIPDQPRCRARCGRRGTWDFASDDVRPHRDHRASRESDRQRARCRGIRCHPPGGSTEQL
jgi:hypothetical protein